MNSSKKEAPVFDPRDPAYRWKLWVRLNSSQGWFTHFFWKRILGLIAALLLALYLSITGAIWANLKVRRGFTEVHYVDLVFPWRWPQYMRGMSTHYLAMGNAALEHGAPDSAFYFYNAALALEPGNPDAHRLASLAQYRMGLKPVALNSLVAGVPAAAARGDEGYLRQFFGMAFETQADDEAYAAGLPLLPAKPDQQRLHLLIAFQLATARFDRGHYADAEKLLAAWGMRSFPEGEVLYAQCEWESGQRDQAVKDLQADVARFKQRDGIYATLEQIGREYHLPEVVLQYSLLRQVGDSEHFPPLLDLLYAYHALHRTEAEQKAVDTYCSQFKSDTVALSQLMQFAVDAGEPKIAERVRPLAQAIGQPTAGFDLGAAEAGIAGRDFAAAARALARIKAEKAPINRTFQATVNGLEVLTMFGTGDVGANLGFANFLPTASALRAPEGVLFAQYLRELGQAEFSRQLLERVYATNPDFEPALIDLVRADLAAGNRAKLAEHLPALLKMRKVPREVLAAAIPLLSRSEDAGLRDQTRALLAASPPAYLSTKR